MAVTRLYPPTAPLQGALVAMVWRDIRGAALSDAQRITHFPASPLMSLSWSIGGALGVIEPRPDGPCWRPFESTVTLTGTRSRPVASWSPGEGAGGIATFTADVARELFGLDPAALNDRFVAAHEALAPSWHPMLDALARAADADAACAVLEQAIGPRWQALRRLDAPLPALRRIGHHWVERLAWRALEWRRDHGPRQVERRVKAFSGRSLREWQSLVRAEGVFFGARDRFDAGLPADWAGLAQDEGFADQSHLVRATRRITGFTPTEFATRFAQDESFWLYRLWV